MRIKFSAELVKILEKIKHKDRRLSDRIEKQLTIFIKNPKHPSLRVHKLSGKVDNRWSISINKSLRMVYCLLDNDVAYFVDIGTHDQVYRQN